MKTNNLSRPKVPGPPLRIKWSSPNSVPILLVVVYVGHPISSATSLISRKLLDIEFKDFHKSKFILWFNYEINLLKKRMSLEITSLSMTSHDAQWPGFFAVDLMS